MPQADHLPRSTSALALFALAMGGFAIGTTEFATMSLLPYMAAGLHIDEPTAGRVISAYALGVVVGAPLLAIVSAHLPRRILLLLFMAVFVLGNAASALAPSYGWMLLFRFLSGLPHGAYFGTGSLVAVSVARSGRRTEAVSRMMLGLTVATVLGVPVANWLGQAAGWRWGFGLVAVLGLGTMLLVTLFVPRDPPRHAASPLGELAALALPQVWFTLGIGAIGCGGLFCVYSYLASTLMQVTHLSPGWVPPVLALFGVGMVAGNLVAPIAGDRALMPTVGAILLLSAAAMLLYPLAAPHPWAICADVFMIGGAASLGSVLQIRLMDVSGHAQALTAALNHSAFNTANAIGPWLGGAAVAAGYGWSATGLVGAGLAGCGLVIWLVSWRAEGAARRRQARGAPCVTE